jgi:2-keto-4-pentenoate hydratase
VSRSTDPSDDGCGVAAFFAARTRINSLARFPGQVPRTLSEAYAFQESAIALEAGRRIGGWKVGLVAANFQKTVGGNRFVGPIWAVEIDRVMPSRTGRGEVFADSESAVEAEVIVEFVAGAPGFTAGGRRDLEVRAFIGVEVCSSPIQRLSRYGPAGIAAAFGNNAGVALGSCIYAGPVRGLDDMLARLRASMIINGHVVGYGAASSLPGGVTRAFHFARQELQRRGRGLLSGDVVATGAWTGAHSVGVGDLIEVDVGSAGSIQLEIAPRTMAGP